jgi:hypothetical protein
VIKSNARDQQQQVASSAGILLEVLFELEDGGVMLLLNVGLSLNYTALQPRRPP